MILIMFVGFQNVFFNEALASASSSTDFQCEFLNLFVSYYYARILYFIFFLVQFMIPSNHASMKVIVLIYLCFLVTPNIVTADL